MTAVCLPSIALLFALLASPHTLRAEEVSADVSGITHQRPASGRYVQVGQRFMVPYTAKIPGTDVSYEMVPVPAGRLTIGSPQNETGRRDDEGPQTTVRIEAFWMGRCEVTWAEYRQYMAIFDAFRRFKELKIRKVTDERRLDAVTGPSTIYEVSAVFEHGEDPALPAASMTQFAAQQYTHWLSGITGRFYRLPSEAEWEYACRAGSKSAYAHGELARELGEFAWYDATSNERTHKVGLKRPNAWGLYDMHGNVNEWVLDAYSAEGYTHLGMGRDVGDGIRWPTKPHSGLVRGGSWNDSAADCRSAARHPCSEDWWEDDPGLPRSPWWLAGDAMTTIGFRIIRPLHVPKREEQNQYWDARGDLRADVEETVQFWRGGRGLVDRDLPDAMRRLSD